VHLWERKTTEDSRMKVHHTIKFLALFFLFSCEQSYRPRERAYPRFDLPQPQYRLYNENHPFSFEASKFAIVYNDSDRLTEPHWVNIRYPQFSAEVQLTYKALNGNTTLLNEHIEDARKLINKHNVKAYGIEESKIRTASGQDAFVFSLTGQVPTQFQFYTTDSSRHFLRGALYFRIATANDSLAPAIRYISQDMIHLINTLKWKDDVR
jgi:gliding motility-associated lipoprotein GldD